MANQQDVQMTKTTEGAKTMSETVNKKYRGIEIKRNEQSKKPEYTVWVNRSGWKVYSLAQAHKVIDRGLDEEIQHNGGNSNLWCDGRDCFVTGCPACDKAHDDRMKPRWARAKALASDLGARGFESISYGANLWKIWAEGLLNGQKVRIEDQPAS